MGARRPAGKESLCYQWRECGVKQPGKAGTREESLGKVGCSGAIHSALRTGQPKRTRWWDGITESMDMSVSKLREIVKDREAWHAAIHEVAKCRTRLGD